METKVKTEQFCIR